MNPYLVFGLLSAALGLAPFLLVYLSTGWHPYPVWLSAWSVSAFSVYGIDKGLFKANGLRVPELVLNLLAAIGGFAGCWAGIFIFHHKSNRSRHPLLWVALILSTIGHAALAYVWLIRG